ncbi:aspartic peptidase domain-containing protein [Usnea florida]
MTSTSAPPPVPSPISWPPSGQWDGDDGKWSSFALRVGSPQQTVRVLVSTTSHVTFVILPGGCPPEKNGTGNGLNCTQSRGGTFNPLRSSSWKGFGNYPLDIELNLGYNDLATFGLDTITLGDKNSTGGLTMKSQVVAGLETHDFYTGMFGLGHQSANYTYSANPYNLSADISNPSLLEYLKSSSLIPSLSWGYNAGAPYRLSGTFGSLTLGGSDASRYTANNVSFSLDPDVNRDMVVGLQSISLTDATRLAVPLLPSAILTFIDSTFPWIYLPIDACEAFEKELGLTWNETAFMYLINDTLHQTLIANNPSFTFTVGNYLTRGPLLTSCFHTQVLTSMSHTIHLRSHRSRGTSHCREAPTKLSTLLADSFYKKRAHIMVSLLNLLGTLNLSHRYLITNYEDSSFSVHQAKFEEGLPEQIIAIPSINTTALPRGPIPSRNTTALPRGSSPVSKKTTLGISLGTTTGVVLLVFALIFAIRKWRRRMARKLDLDGVDMPNSIHEIDNNSLYWNLGELDDTGKTELLDKQWPSGSGNHIQEMPPHTPPPFIYELRTGRSLTNHSLISASRVSVSTNKKTVQELCSRSDTSKKLSNIRTTDSASGRQVPSQRRPSRPRNLKVGKPARSPLQSQQLDADQSLNTTPITESLQSSLVATGFPNRFTISDYVYDISRRTSVALSTLIAKPAKVLVRPKYVRLSDLSVAMEIVVPPGFSGPSESSVDSSGHKKEPKQLGGFF